MIDGLTNDVFQHGFWDDVFISWVRLSVQKTFFRVFSGKSKRCKSVHDEVEPKKLNRSQYLCFKNCSSNKSTKNCNKIDSQLELNEFSDRIIDVSSPEHSFDNRWEVIINKSYSSSLSSNLSSSNSHSESNISFFKCRSIISSITSNSNNITSLSKSSNKSIFILRSRSS